LKNILLAVVGLSPQVVTETLFALHQEGKQVDAIYLITTATGKELIASSLLSPAFGRYHRYLKEYGIDPSTISFGFENVHVVKDLYGKEIRDITSDEDNEHLLRCCLDLTFRFTSSPDTTVFFSIAGGRKTMSASLMVAAQLYGRPQDRVYHVLVSPEFENSEDFYYPTRPSQLIRLYDENRNPFFKETRYATVTLVPIPFVSIRGQIAADLLQEPREPAELMLSLIREEPAILTIDIPSGKVIYRQREIDMMPARLALYAFFALLKKDCPLQKEKRSCRDCTDCYLSFYEVAARQKDITELYRGAAGKMVIESEMSDTGITNINAENFNSYRIKIRRDLERGFGAVNAARLAISSTGQRPDKRYGIELDRQNIRVVL